MTLKKFLFVFISTILILTSCSESSEVSNAIPADAKYVLYVNNKSLIDKSEYDIFQNQTVQRGINMGKAFMKDQKQIKLLDSFLKDANSLGINLKNDFYMYTNYNVFGVVLGVNDAKKVKEALITTSLVKEDNLKEENGIYSVSPETGACLTWDKNKIILLIDLSKGKTTEGAEVVDVITLAKEQLSQSSDKSINSKKEYQEFWKNRKDISVFTTLNGLDKLLTMNKTSEQLDVDVQKYFKDLEGLSFGGYVSFEKGEIIASNKMFCDTPETEKRIKKIAAQVSGNLNGDHLKYINEEPLFAASVNINGTNTENYLRELGFFEDLTNQMDSIDAVVFDEVLKNVNGDVTFALTSIEVKTVKSEYSDTDRQEPIPQCFLLIDVKDPSYIVNLIKEKTKESSKEIIEISPSVFSAALDDNNTAYFGVVNNTFFATNIASIYKDMNSTDLKNNYTKLVKGKSAIVFGDIQVLKSILEKNSDLLHLSDKDKAALKFTQTFAKYQLSLSTESLEGEGIVGFVNTSDNSLKAICKSFDDQINALASLFF